jgi:hypothetical protein
MTQKQTTTTAPVDALVIRAIAIEDARYVLRWLHQQRALNRAWVPNNIAELADKALERFDAADEADYESAEAIPITEAEIETIVRKVVDG